MIVRFWILVLATLLVNKSYGLQEDQGQSSILSRPTCQAFNQVLNDQWQELNRLYLGSDSRFTKIELENSPYFISNSETDLIILLHGFLGSPHEMNRLAGPLKNKGYSVLNDLIPGYGFSARVANQFTEQYWNQYFSVRYTAAFQCFKRVHLIGFSTGGLIIHKFLMTNPKLKAASVHLISPFYSPTLKFVTFFTLWFSRFQTEVPLSFLYLSTMGLKELKIMIRYPDYYLRDAPYLNMNEIAKSGQEVIDYKSQNKNQSPVVVYATSKDLVMDFETTMKMVSRDFSNSKLVNFSETQAPHHLFWPEVSDVASEFEKQILDYF